MAFRRRERSAPTGNTGQKADKFGQVAITNLLACTV
jgi:hypothetical protein